MHLGQLCLEAGFPPGTLNVLVGTAEAGQAIVRHPDVDKLAFTGGPTTAAVIMAESAPALTPMVLELGGKSASLVFADCEIEEAARLIARLAMANTGQACASPTRVLIERSIYDEVTGEIVRACEVQRVGLPADPSTEVGPVISEAALERILNIVRQAERRGSGRLLTGGARLDGELASGFFLPPTVFGEVGDGTELAREEIFGPVLVVAPFDTEEEAIARANGTRWALAAYVHTSDLKRALRVVAQLDAGWVSVNTGMQLAPGAPFGGVKDSGFGREGGRAGLDEFLRHKNVYLAY